MRKTFKILAISIGVAAFCLALSAWLIHKPLPEGRTGAEADRLADKMLAAVNMPAWDTLAYISWVNPYSEDRITWDRARNWVHLKGAGKEAWIDPENNKGVVYDETGREMVGDRLREAVEKNLWIFWNDAFWIMAFTKVKDPGTTRAVVELGDGTQGLLVTYTSGGSTPGDSYLWELDPKGLPTAWRVWAKVIPIGGVRFTWEDWAELPGGAKYARLHRVYGFTLRREMVLGGPTLESVGAQPQLYNRLERYLKENP